MILLALANLCLQYFVLFLFRHVSDVLLDRFLFFRTFVFILLWHLTDEVHMLCRVATQHDVGTTTSHVGSDGHCSTTPRLCDNLRLTLVMFCIQHIVWYALPVEQL